MEIEIANSVNLNDIDGKTRFILQKKLSKFLKRRKKRRLEDTIKDLQNEYGKEKAFKIVTSTLTKIKKKKKHNKNGDQVQMHPGNMTFQQQNHLLQDNNNNNNYYMSLAPPLIQSPNQYNFAIDQKDGGTLVAPSMVGNNIQGDVIMNVQAPQLSRSTSTEILPELKNEMKRKLKLESERILEGCESESVCLNEIYTELFIISDESDPINREHEIWQIETHDLSSSTQTLINYNQILHPVNKNQSVKIVLTKGIAGIGKTVTVQKFVLDWANGEANPDLDFVFLLPFRELNLLQGELSLFDLLCVFHPELRKAGPISDWIWDRKLLFILDGLDEYKTALDFQSRLLSSVTEAVSVDVLLVNLLQRKLLPSAHLWITSRPVAVEQLPRQIFLHGYKTQIRGFRDEQKEEYFSRQFLDTNLTRDVVRHLKTQRSLWILCHIPLFCWISSVVLKDIIKSQSRDRPTNLTEMYIHYLLVQTGLSHWKYDCEELSQEDALQRHRDLILRLAALAYGQLMEQSVIFRREDLEKYSITVEEAAQYPGVITCVSKRSFGYKTTKLFSFVHLSVQEFFAALFAFHEFVSGNQDSLKLITAKNRQKSDLCDFLKSVIDTALQSKNGHLDLFSRFIFGISCESRRSLLQDFLPEFWGRMLDVHKTVTTYIKSLRRKDLSSERCISLVHCLLELKDRSFLQDMEELERSRSAEPLMLFQCTLLAYQFVTSDTKREEFDLRKYNMTLEGFHRFSPAIRCFRKVSLKGSSVTEQHCELLKVYLSSPNSPLTDLDLSHNGLGWAALEPLSTALLQPDCRIHTLSLRHNQLQSLDMGLIRDVLSGEHSSLRVLDLSDNPVEDSGAKTLASALRRDNCRLEVLKLSGCQIEVGVHDLVSSLKANPSYLRELDLRYNHLGNFSLEITELLPLRISTGGVCGHQAGLDKYAVSLTFDPETANEHLHLTDSSTAASRQKDKHTRPVNDKRFDRSNQVLSHQPLRGRSFFTVDVIGRDVHVGVACERMERKGAGDAVCLGQNEMSWSLRCSDKVCVSHHNRRAVCLSECVRELGVFVDREAGSVCFYRLSPQFRLLYMFDADFPEDQEVYAAFRLPEPDSAIRLRQEALRLERC